MAVLHPSQGLGVLSRWCFLSRTEKAKSIMPALDACAGILIEILHQQEGLGCFCESRNETVVGGNAGRCFKRVSLLTAMK